MAFVYEPGRFSGPGQGIVDEGGADEFVLPITDGDATVTITEETFDETNDITGVTPRKVWVLGRQAEVIYPTKTAAMKAYALASRGDVTTATTADPDGSASLAAVQSISAPADMLHEKTAYSFKMWLTKEPLWDASGDIITRTVDKDIPSFMMDDAVYGPSGNQMTAHNTESPYQIQIRGILPAVTDTFWRLMNIDLALA